jgi:hypothetical protein
MAVYKVIQDIESEDKIVGFLTLKTFVYALIAGALIYVNIRFLLASILGPLRFVFVFILFWPMILFAVLAAPLGGEQSTEVWILAHVRFFLKPRVRIWNQSGLLELVTITAPKKIERNLTNNLTQREVRSRLKALATTLDTRGWAVRNVGINLNANPSYLDIVEPESDRLTAGSNLPSSQTQTDINESDDIMDEQNNPTAQHFEALMQEEDEKRKQKVSEMIVNTQQKEASKPAQISEEVDPEPAPDYGFLDKIAGKAKDTTSFVSHVVVTPGSQSSPDKAQEQIDSELAKAEQDYIEKERKLTKEIHARSAGFKPVSQPPHKPPEPQPKPDKQAMTKAFQNANLKELAQSGNELSVASVQHLANRKENIRHISPNEVEIDFHSH